MENLMMNGDPFLTDLYFGKRKEDEPLDYEDIRRDAASDAVIAEYERISQKYPPDVLEKQGTLPRALIEELKAINFFGLSIPREYGGLGLTLHQYLKVVEAVIGHNMALGLTGMAHLSIGVKGIVLFGNESQKQKYLVPAASGETIFSYALTEPKHGSDAQHIETSAVLSEDGDHYLLNGSKAYITNANYAGAMTVFAQMKPDEPGYMGAFIVETHWDGVKIGRDIPKMGLKASSTAAVQFQKVKVPRDNLIGRPGDGFKIAMTILNYGRLALGAASSGMMEKSLQAMQKRAASRKQFGQTINHFELIQEKMVKAAVNSYVVSTMTAFTASLLTQNPLANVAMESSHCKLFGTTRAWTALYDALQVAGGSGYLATQPYERRMRDFRVTTIFEGTTEIHSIYPGLTLMRKMGKRLRNRSSPQKINLAQGLRALLSMNHFEMALEANPVKKAVRFTKWTAVLIRILIFLGLLTYKEKVYQRQFLLRRITHLSMYCMGLIAVLIRIQAAWQNGRRLDKDLQYLSFFLEEARRYRKGCFHILPTREDMIARRIYQEAIRQ
jgi:acyl-CoA dehydrogenase family protein 9